jgi:DNA-binding CsgD family transcriptional regulator
MARKGSAIWWSETELTRDVCVELYEEEGYSPDDIGEMIGCSGRTVRKVLAIHEIPLRQAVGWRQVAGAPRPVTLEQVLTKDYFQTEFVEKGRTISEIAAEHGCSTDAVRHHLDRQNIPRDRREPKLREAGMKLTRRLLIDEYVIKQRSTYEIADDIGCSQHAVLNALRRERLEVRSSPNVASPAREKLTPAVLRDLYIDKGMSADDIGRLYGCSRNVVLGQLRNHNLPVRRRSAAARNRRRSPSPRTLKMAAESGDITHAPTDEGTDRPGQAVGGYDPDET